VTLVRAPREEQKPHKVETLLADPKAGVLSWMKKMTKMMMTRMKMNLLMRIRKKMVRKMKMMRIINPLKELPVWDFN